MTVATSDGLEQVIIRGQGCKLLSARELFTELERTNEDIRERFLEKGGLAKEALGPYIPEEATGQESSLQQETNSLQ